MKISVIIPTYNRRQLLDFTLDALRKQTLDKDQYDVIVVDDGSTDDTRAVVDRHRPFQDIKYIYQDDLGFRAAAARNLGIASSKHEICVCIDTGILLHKDALRCHQIVHQNATRNLAVNAYTYAFQQHDITAQQLIQAIDLHDLEGTLRTFEHQKIHLDIREEVYSHFADDMNRMPAPWALFWGCHTSVKRQVLLDVGLFDNRFESWGCEDDELAYRLYKQGIAFKLCRDACGIHYPHPKNETQNTDSGLRNLEYMYAKHNDPVILERCRRGWEHLNLVPA